MTFHLPISMDEMLCCNITVLHEVCTSTINYPGMSMGAEINSWIGLQDGIPGATYISVQYVMKLRGQIENVSNHCVDEDPIEIHIYLLYRPHHTPTFSIGLLPEPSQKTKVGAFSYKTNSIMPRMPRRANAERLLCLISGTCTGDDSLHYI